MSDPFQLGPRGEALAWHFLKQRGYRILEKNYRTRFGEVDVVAEKDQSVVFLEIKTRRNHDFGRPEEAVDRRKQGKMARVAESYLQARGLGERAARFDILSVIWDGTREPEFSLIEDAFILEET